MSSPSDRAEYFRNYKRSPESVEAKGRRKRERVRSLRARFEAYKAGLRCACGEKHPAALDFHHVEGKRLGISQMLRGGYSFETVIAEVAKCVVMCANCHRKEHYKNRGIKSTNKKGSGECAL